VATATDAKRVQEYSQTLKKNNAKANDNWCFCGFVYATRLTVDRPQSSKTVQEAENRRM
jgi:hypothetical protein